MVIQHLFQSGTIDISAVTTLPLDHSPSGHALGYDATATSQPVTAQTSVEASGGEDGEGSGTGNNGHKPEEAPEVEVKEPKVEVKEPKVKEPEVEVKEPEVEVKEPKAEAAPTSVLDMPEARVMKILFHVN